VTSGEVPAGVVEYADGVMALVAAGMRDDPDMRGARSFDDLHDYCDAHEYMTLAHVPYEPHDSEVMGVYLAVQDEVTRRLAAV
jgi:hypothetical protein